MPDYKNMRVFRRFFFVYPLESMRIFLQCNGQLPANATQILQTR